MACYTAKEIIDFASKANIKVDIQTLNLTDDGYGGQASSWASDGLFWAYITPYRGSKELFASGQSRSELYHSIFIRYRAAYANTRDFSSKRVVYNSRIFNIAYIRNLDEAMKQEGKYYHEIFACENQTQIGTA